MCHGQATAAALHWGAAVGAVPHGPPPPARSTAYLRFIELFLDSPVRTENPWEANMFFVPMYGAGREAWQMAACLRCIAPNGC